MEKIQEFSIGKFDEEDVERNFKTFFNCIPLGAVIFGYNEGEYYIEGINDTAISTLNKWGKYKNLDLYEFNEEDFIREVDEEIDGEIPYKYVTYTRK